MAKEDGGAAFPTTPVSHGYAHDSHGSGTGASPGMTLRDYFAAAAMQGLLASNAPVDNVSFKLVASIAYQQADAMLAERAK